IPSQLLRMEATINHHSIPLPPRHKPGPLGTSTPGLKCPGRPPKPRAEWPTHTFSPLSLPLAGHPPVRPVTNEGADDGEEAEVERRPPREARGGRRRPHPGTAARPQRDAARAVRHAHERERGPHRATRGNCPRRRGWADERAARQPRKW